MIRQGEVQKIAANLGLRDTQIEKDYVLGWILFGIVNQDKLNKDLAFKGGTSLRKIYFEDYRLSEDLDFTFVGKDFNIDKIREGFKELVIWVKEESRIDLSILDETEHETGNYNFYLSYVGPLGGKSDSKKIKIDISSNEEICNQLEMRKVLNEYSDLDEYEIQVYSLDEIIAEKLRSLMQRTEPRDLYDLWYLFEYERKDIVDLIADLKVKAENKGLDPTKLIKAIESKEGTFKKQWDNRLVNQIHDLPNFDDVWRELGKHWRKYEKNI